MFSLFEHELHELHEFSSTALFVRLVRFVFVYNNSSWSLNKTCSVVWFYPEDLEGAFVFGELLQIFLGEGLLDGFLVGGIYESDAGTFEASTGEAAAIDSGEGTHDLVDGDELRGAALVIVDAGLAGVKAQFAEELQVARFPS